MKRKMNKRAMVLLISIGLILVASVGATLAYLHMQTGPVINVFGPAEVSCAVVEENYTGQGNEQTSISAVTNASIKNTGDIDAYIRAKIVVTWKNAAGVVYAKAPATTDYTLKTSASEQWLCESGGFWYFAQAVKPDENTEVLLVSCELTDNAAVPEGYFLSVEIVASAIQANPVSVVAEQWGVTVNTDSDDAIADGTITAVP